MKNPVKFIYMTSSGNRGVRHWRKENMGSNNPIRAFPASQSIVQKPKSDVIAPAWEMILFDPSGESELPPVVIWMVLHYPAFFEQGESTRSQAWWIQFQGL